MTLVRPRSCLRDLRDPRGIYSTRQWLWNNRKRCPSGAIGPKVRFFTGVLKFPKVGNGTPVGGITTEIGRAAGTLEKLRKMKIFEKSQNRPKCSKATFNGCLDGFKTFEPAERLWNWPSVWHRHLAGTRNTAYFRILGPLKFPKVNWVRGIIVVRFWLLSKMMYYFILKSKISLR